MPDPSPVGKAKTSRLVPGLAVVVLAAAGWVCWRMFPVGAWISKGVAEITALGPWAFFLAMAILPGLGVPASLFTLTAGSAFEARMGICGVVAAGCAAMAINLTLTFWLARGVLRRPLERLFDAMGYTLPKVDRSDITDLIVILRVTPGFPFFVQNYLLGLADAPPGRYFLISVLTTLPYTVAFIVFGDALLHGRGYLVILSLSLIVALVAATHIVRRHYAGRKASA
jgi:uncharacterized membrane protein YdjX (TVP38/TMEM64 family)